MKYTFTNAEGARQTVDVPDDYIIRNKVALECSTKDAIMMYLSDEGYIENDTVRELTEKAKGTVKHEAGKRKAPARKPDYLKRAVIASLEAYLNDAVFNWEDKEDAPRNIEVKNIERIISFTVGDGTYELTLSKKRK